MTKEKFDQFNLLPPITKEEVVSIEERDNSVLYGFLLVFLSVIVFVIFTIGDLMLIQTRKTSLNSTISEVDQEISELDSIKEINGEIFLKSNALAPIVSQDIKLTTLIDVADKLVENTDGGIVQQYERISDGRFRINVLVSGFDQLNIISQNSKLINNLEDFYIERISSNGDLAESTLSFILTNI